MPASHRGIIAKHVIRPVDLAARYGGEELAVLRPNTDVNGSEKIGTQICEAKSSMQESVLPHWKIIVVAEPGRSIRLTNSTGQRDRRRSADPAKKQIRPIRRPDAAGCPTKHDRRSLF